MLPTDWGEPGTGVLGRLSDGRARQFWDKDHLVAKRMAEDARDPQPKPECCNRKGVFWDMAAVYPRGARWEKSMPPAVFFNGTVIQNDAALEAAIVRAQAR